MAAKHQLPAIYSARFFAADGGLIAYGPDRIDQFPRAAGYVDRLLKGEKPADLTSSARASSVGGISRPRVLAVLRLMTSSTFVGACTGQQCRWYDRPRRKQDRWAVTRGRHGLFRFGAS